MDAEPAIKPKRKRIPQPLEAAQIPGALLTLRTASSVSGMSVDTLYRRAASDPTFPRLIRNGKRCTRVVAGPFMAWLAAQGTTT